MKQPRQFAQVVMLGDSLTWSADVPFGRRYGDFIEGNLQDKSDPEVLVDVAVCGDGSDTVAQGLARVERDVLAYDPDYVLINLGGNNHLRERKFLRADLRAFIQRLREAAPATVIVLETVPFIDEQRHCYRDHPEVIRTGGLNKGTERIHAIIRKVACENGLAVHDRYRLFHSALKRNPALKDRFICEDGIHFTAAGNRYFAQSAAAALLGCSRTVSKAPRKPPAFWYSRAKANPVFAESCRCCREGGLELFLRTSGSWSRLMLQQVRSFARRASWLAPDASLRKKANDVAALAAALSAYQRALGYEIHRKPEAENVRWALSQLPRTSTDPLVTELRNRLRRS